MTSLLLNACSAISFLPINNLFPYNWNKPTFAAACSKLLLNIWVRLSKAIVRGSMKFSNSSSSSPTGTERKTNQQKHPIILTLLFGRVTLTRLSQRHPADSRGTAVRPTEAKTRGLTYFYRAMNKDDKRLMQTPCTRDWHVSAFPTLPSSSPCSLPSSRLTWQRFSTPEKDPHKQVNSQQLENAKFEAATTNQTLPHVCAVARGLHHSTGFSDRAQSFRITCYFFLPPTYLEHRMKLLEINLDGVGVIHGTLLPHVFQKVKIYRKRCCGQGKKKLFWVGRSKRAWKSGPVLFCCDPERVIVNNNFLEQLFARGLVLTLLIFRPLMRAACLSHADSPRE